VIDNRKAKVLNEQTALHLRAL